MTSDKANTEITGKPPVVDLATWHAAREELLVSEKAHTREGEAIAAARRRLPMVEVNGTIEVTGAHGPVPFIDLFQGRKELLIGQLAVVTRRSLVPSELGAADDDQR